MRLSPATHRAWWELHRATALVAGLVLYVMCYFGSWTLFLPQVRTWQEERGAPATLVTVDRALERHADAMDRAAIRVRFPRASDPGFSIQYEDAGGAMRRDRVTADGALVAPRSGLAGFFHDLHFLQPDGAPGWLLAVAGLCAAFWLLLLVTGLSLELRDLPRHLHRFRPRGRPALAWSDAHKVLATLGLPFVLLYATTGAWLGLEEVISPALADHVFGGDRARAAAAERGAPGPKVALAGVRAARRSLVELRARAEVAGRGRCRGVRIEHLGDREALGRFTCEGGEVALRLRDGAAVIGPTPVEPAATARVREVPEELHYATYAGGPLRALYGLLGLAACLTIVTGARLWLARRPPDRLGWLYHRALLAVAGGALVASAAILVANRLVVGPASERAVFWLAWALAAAASLLAREVDAAWRAALALAGTGLCAVPLLGGVTVGAGLFRWPAGLDAARAVDLALAIAGVALVALSRHLARRARLARMIHEDTVARCEMPRKIASAPGAGDEGGLKPAEKPARTKAASFPADRAAAGGLVNHPGLAAMPVG